MRLLGLICKGPLLFLGDLLLRFGGLLGRFLGRRLFLGRGLLGCCCRLGLIGLGRRCRLLRGLLLGGRRLLRSRFLGRRLLLGGLGLLRLGRLLSHFEGAVGAGALADVLQDSLGGAV